MNDMWLHYFTNDTSFPFFIQYGEHTDTMFMHHHIDFSELVVVLNGTAEHVVENERFPVKKGDVFVMGKGICHGYDNATDFRICNIMFRPEDFLVADHDVKQLPGFHALFMIEAQVNNAQGFRSRLKLSHGSFSELEKLLDATVEEYFEDRPGRKTLLLAYFMQIVTMLSRLYDAPKKQREISGMAEAAAFMEMHYMDDISIDRLIEISHYSQRHFIRLFASAYNTTPQKYLNNIRLRKACVMLKENSSQITDIATKCGFSDSNYFSRAFKKSIGVTPSQYRNGII